MRQQHRSYLQRLVRRHGPKPVSALCGLTPATIANFIADIGRPHPGTVRAVELAFEQLGPSLGLEPEIDLPRRELTPLPGEPRLRLVRPSDGVPKPRNGTRSNER